MKILTYASGVRSAMLIGTKDLARWMHKAKKGLAILYFKNATKPTHLITPGRKTDCAL